MPLAFLKLHLMQLLAENWHKKGQMIGSSGGNSDETLTEPRKEKETIARSEVPHVDYRVLSFNRPRDCQRKTPKKKVSFKLVTVLGL